ncbi:hypothetical protein THIOKS12720003 [Thiocapsa sp. KS1]|nr:hypothetical protein THIOKS12720003 [Thiocapsa sp. KS1]
MSGRILPALGALVIWPAILVTSLLFGGIHSLNVFTTGHLLTSVIQSGAALLSGLLFIAIRLRTGSLWPAIITHSGHLPTRFCKPPTGRVNNRGLKTMIKPLAVSLLLGSFVVAGCVESSSTTSTATPVVTGGDLAGVPARACQAAIAKKMGRSASDVAVFDVAESEAGITVEATVAGAEAPWRCYTDRSGRVSNVMYTGSEGAL